ncbi:ribosomal RNA small subunit methyltransferase A, partial [Patescibacteria group bacterium]|nr:ribosomal RNA small subunit methyltransferase A [Patescibacteria group bacterium]
MVNTPVAKKALGQNFLTDQTVVQLMIEALDVQSNDTIIEIGSGTGAVTKPLAQVCQAKDAHLTAVEFDIDLIPLLESAVPQTDQVTIINANILNFLEDFKVPKNNSFKIIGSLPYNITSPLLHQLIKYHPQPETIIVLIQKEVAQKICDQPPHSNYLSVFVQTFYEAKILKEVDKSLFNPIPAVDGAILQLLKKSQKSNFDISRYEKFLHHIFSHPRKMLNKVLTKEELEKYNFAGTKRAQDYGDG